MEIAHVVCLFPPHRGGIGSMAQYIAKHSARLGHEVTIFTPKYNKQVESIETEDGYTVERLRPLFKYGVAAILPQLFWKLQKFDIVHLHLGFYGSDFIVFLLKLIRSKTKLVIHYHNDVVGAGLIGFIFKTHAKLFLPFILKIADRVIAISEPYIENSYLKKINEKRKLKLITIPNGVDTKIFAPQEAGKELQKTFKLKEDDKVVLFVGGLGPNHYFKGLSHLLKAFEILKNKKDIKNLKLLIVGDGACKSDYIEEAKKLNIDKNIIFAGGVGHKKLAKYYNLCTIFVLPSEQESFGLVLAEAMACKKPVVATRLPGTGEVFVDNESGLFFKLKNYEDLAEKISLLLENDELREKITENGYNRVTKLFSWEKIIDKFLEVYKQVL